jgi:tetratricopeptide (TPR) repeat protein
MDELAAKQTTEALVNRGREFLQARASAAAARQFMRSQLIAPANLVAVVNHALCDQQQPQAGKLFYRSSILAPSHPAVLANLGAYFAQSSDCSNMLRAYRRLALAAPADARGGKGLAKAWLIGCDRDGRFHGAEKHVHECLRWVGVLNPNDQKIRFQHVQLLIASGAMDAAHALMAPVIAAGDQSIQAMIPDDFDLGFLSVLASDHWMEGRLTEAYVCLDLILCRDPTNATALLQRGIYLRTGGNLSASRDSLRLLLITRPRYSAGMNGLKITEVAQNLPIDAIRRLRQYCVLNPLAFVGAVTELSVLGFQAEEPKFGKKMAIRGILASPDDCTNYQHLVRYLIQNRLFKPAGRLLAWLEFIALSSITCNLLGWLFLHRGEYKAAEKRFQQAIDLDSRNVSARVNLSMLRMKSGEIEKALADYELRWQLGWNKDQGYEMYPQPSLDIPVWDGSDLRGKRVYVRGEQGVGDEIWFVGLLPALISGGATITLECIPKLVPLLQRSFPDVKVCGRGNGMLPTLNDVDYQIPIGSLMKFLCDNSYQAPTNYLAADTNLAADRRRLYSDNGRQKVIGISWRSLKRVHRRSFEASLHHWQALKNLPNCAFVSLQYGDTAEERAAFKQATGIEIRHDHSIDIFNDVDGMAAQVQAVDAVISIANSTVMLAHAIGTPAWVALRKHQEDWRYRLFHQHSNLLPKCRHYWPRDQQNWARTIGDISNDVKSFLASVKH